MRSAATALTLRKALLILGVALTLVACAAESPRRTFGLEQKIEQARTRLDHVQLATLYQRRANVDQANAEKHETLATKYPQTRGYSGLYRDTVEHCNNLARAYRQAAAENTALAQPHREMAAQGHE